MKCPICNGSGLIGVEYFTNTFTACGGCNGRGKIRSSTLRFPEGGRIGDSQVVVGQEEEVRPGGEHEPVPAPEAPGARRGDN